MTDYKIWHLVKKPFVLGVPVCLECGFSGPYLKDGIHYWSLRKEDPDKLRVACTSELASMIAIHDS